MYTQGYALSAIKVYIAQCTVQFTQCTEMQGCMKYGSHQGKCPQPVTLPPFCSTIIILVLVVHSRIIIWWSTFSCVKDLFLIVLVFSLISYHREPLSCVLFLLNCWWSNPFKFIGDLSPLSYSWPICSPILTLSPSHNFDNFGHQEVGYHPSAELR